MVSRSAEQHCEAPELVNELEKTGCKAIVRNCDVADPSDLKKLLSALRNENVPPISGVIQAAMALQVSRHGRWID
jgi:short-subunit dehydrogenase